MRTNVYVCADGTMTYGPQRAGAKIIPQALPVAEVEDEQAAMRLITLVGRLGYDLPGTDAHFEEELKGRPMPEGCGPTRRYYVSLPEWERGNVESLFRVRDRIAAMGVTK